MAGSTSPEFASSKKPSGRKGAADGVLLAHQRVQDFIKKRRRDRREERRKRALERQLRSHNSFSLLDSPRFGESIEQRVLAEGGDTMQSASEEDGNLRNASDTNDANGAGAPRRPRRSKSQPQMPTDQESSCKSAWDGNARYPSREALLPPLPVSCAHVQSRRRRIAVVGGGPVGLWAATLILLRHGRRVKGPAAETAAASGQHSWNSWVRTPDAPEIVVFEKRGEAEHCSRRNVRITLDEQTVALLNKHTNSRCFVSGMALAEIERILLDQWRSLADGKSLMYNSPVDSPVELTSSGDWDLVLWAGGRWSLDNELRQDLGCSMHVGDSEDVLVFEMRQFSHQQRSSAAQQVRLQDLAQLAAVDLASVARQAALAVLPADAGSICPYRVVLRFAREAGSKRNKGPPIAWLWLLGLPEELTAAGKSAAGQANGRRPCQHKNLLEALDSELTWLGVTCGELPGNPLEPMVGTPSQPAWVVRLRAAVAALQDRVFSPAEVSVRWVDASYWSSSRVVCKIAGDASGRSTPLVLIGDVAMGKPFYLGTTLNVHLAEVKALSRLPVMRWGTPLDAGMDEPGATAVAPWLAYEQRYRELVKRIPGFCRRPVLQ